jgi:hypothetical protein
MRDDLDLTADLPRLVNDAHRSPFDRDIQTRLVFHTALLPLRPEAAPNDPRCTISLQCSTSPGIEGSGGRPNTPSQQSRGKLASAVPPTRARDAGLWITKVPAAVRQRVLCCSQSFRSTPLSPLRLCHPSAPPHCHDGMEVCGQHRCLSLSGDQIGRNVPGSS